MWRKPVGEGAKRVTTVSLMIPQGLPTRCPAAPRWGGCVCGRPGMRRRGEPCTIGRGKVVTTIHIECGPAAHDLWQVGTLAPRHGFGTQAAAGGDWGLPGGLAPRS